MRNAPSPKSDEHGAQQPRITTIRRLAEALDVPHAISERLLVSRGAVTQIIDALEKRGLVRRIAHPRDRRSLLVEMTAEGRSLRREVEPVLTRRDEVWMGGLCAEERDAFLRLLEKTQAHLERTPEGDG